MMGFGVYKTQGTAVQNVGYKSYVATLTQSATNAPVATIISNTLDGDIVWTYGGDPGVYFGTLTGAFTENKTFLIIGNYNNIINVQLYFTEIFRESANEVSISTFRVTEADAGGNLNKIGTNGVLNSTPIEIRVYP